MAEKEADLLVDEEDQATDAPELAITQKKRALGTYVGAFFDELMRAGWDKPAKYVPLHEQLIALLTDNQEGASK